MKRLGLYAASWLLALADLLEDIAGIILIRVEPEPDPSMNGQLIRVAVAKEDE